MGAWRTRGGTVGGAVGASLRGLKQNIDYSQLLIRLMNFNIDLLQDSKTNVVLYWSSSGPLLVLYWFCTGPVLVLYWSSPGSGPSDTRTLPVSVSGGRMSTSRHSDSSCQSADLGAQYITATPGYTHTHHR